MLFINEVVYKEELLGMGLDLDGMYSCDHYASLCKDLCAMMGELDGIHFVDASKHERRYAEMLATPKWLQLRDFIEISAKCPKGMSIDHIVPLRGERVCGLHVPWNIQYIPIAHNVAKGNTYPY